MDDTILEKMAIVVFAAMILVYLSGCASSANQKKVSYLFGLAQYEYYNSDSPYQDGGK